MTGGPAPAVARNDNYHSTAMRYREKHQPPEGILDLADEPLQRGTGPPEDQVAFFGASGRI